MPLARSERAFFASGDTEKSRNPNIRGNNKRTVHVTKKKQMIHKGKLKNYADAQDGTIVIDKLLTIITRIILFSNC